MNKSHLGNKYKCYVCSKPFYDLGKEEAICPKCGADQKNCSEQLGTVSSGQKLKKKVSRSVYSISVSAEDQLRFEQDFPVRMMSVGEGGAQAQKMGKEYEIAVGDILDKGKAVFDEEYPLRDVRSYGLGTDRIDQLIKFGWHGDDRPVENNPLLGFPVACLLETKGQNTSGTADQKLDHAVRRLARCCNYYKVSKGRIVVAGNAIKDDFLLYLNEEAIPDTRSCDRLDIAVIRIGELWRRMHYRFPL